MVDIKTMAKITQGRAILIKRAEDAIEKIFCCGGFSIAEYCDYSAELEREIKKQYGATTWENYIYWRYGDD